MLKHILVLCRCGLLDVYYLIEVFLENILINAFSQRIGANFPGILGLLQLLEVGHGLRRKKKGNMNPELKSIKPDMTKAPPQYGSVHRGNTKP